MANQVASLQAAPANELDAKEDLRLKQIQAQLDAVLKNKRLVL
jgi:hypothetical protein